MTYPNELTNPAAANWPARVNEAFKSLRGPALYAPNDLTTTGLTEGGFGGEYGATTIADWTVALTNATTNYIVAHRTTGAVTSSTATTNWNDTAVYGRVRRCVTAGGVVTARIDWRLLSGGIFDNGAAAGFGDVVGPASSTDSHFAQFDGTTGKLLKGGLALDTDATLAAASNTRVPSQAAVKSYADALVAAASGSGTKTYAVFTPMDSQPPAANFATLDTRNSIAVLDFDDTTEESIFWVGVMPEAASLGSGLIVNIFFMATTATSGDCRFGAQFERMNTDEDSDSFDTATEATVATNGTSGIITKLSITCTTIDSIAAGEPYRLKIYRDTSGADTITGDVEVVSVELRSAA